MRKREMSSVRRVLQSLIGHIAVFQICWSLPMLLLNWDKVYYNGGPTLGGVLYMIFLASGFGLLFAVAFYFTVSRPIIRMRERSSESKGD